MESNRITPGRSSRPLDQSVAIAKGSEKARVVAAIVLAFSADPAVRWLYPDRNQFLSSVAPRRIRQEQRGDCRRVGAKYSDGGAAYLQHLQQDKYP
jgi:hypothetical protein